MSNEMENKSAEIECPYCIDGKEYETVKEYYGKEWRYEMRAIACRQCKGHGHLTVKCTEIPEHDCGKKVKIDVKTGREI